MDQLSAIFCDMDDCCQAFEPGYARRLLHAGQRQRTRQTTLALSEILTLLVYCHWSPYRPFKHDYTAYVAVHLHSCLPQLVRSQRLLEWLPRALVPLCCSLSTRKGRCTGIACIDSTPLAVCDNHRLATHKVFEGLAPRGKTSMGWCYGFKLPLLVKDEGELWAFRLTPGNIDDRQPVERLATGLGGQLFGDRGSISQALHERLLDQALALLTKIRQTMKNRGMRLWNTWLLRQRVLIEPVNDQLKNISQMDHTRHRSVTGFRVHLVAGVIAYSHRPKKPSWGLPRDPMFPMLVL
jgi:hypothetical protein